MRIILKCSDAYGGVLQGCFIKLSKYYYILIFRCIIIDDKYYNIFKKINNNDLVMKIISIDFSI